MRRPIGITLSSTLFRDEGIYLIPHAQGGPEYQRIGYDYPTLGTMVEQEEKSYLTHLGLILLSVSVVLQAFALFAP